MLAGVEMARGEYLAATGVAREATRLESLMPYEFGPPFVDWPAAEGWETARFAASLVRIEYENDEFETDIEAARDKAFVVKKPESARGNAAKAFAAVKKNARAQRSAKPLRE